MKIQKILQDLAMLEAVDCTQEKILRVLQEGLQAFSELEQQGPKNSITLKMFYNFLGHSWSYCSSSSTSNNESVSFMKCNVGMGTRYQKTMFSNPIFQGPKCFEYLQTQWTNVMYFFEYLAALLENTMGEKLVYFHDRAVEYHERRSDGRSLTRRQKRTLSSQAVSALKWTFQVKHHSFKFLFR